MFVDTDGARKTIRLGKMSKRQAEAVKLRVEDLAGAKLSGGTPGDETSRWLASIDDTLRNKLAAVGLASKRESSALEPFVESYIARRTDISPNTQRIWRQTARKLTAHFGPGKAFAEITRGAATDWRLSLISSGLADASVRKHCGFAKHFFAQAIDHELITVNPFGKLVSSPVGNESRQFFVTQEAIEKVLDAAPDATWRLIIALSRFGGLRCPSEHLALRWEDVDWEHKRLHVTSPKTARHAGHESRELPIFPELMPHLEAAWEAAEPGTEFVIDRYRNQGANLRTQLRRIVKRAGLAPWPRIFHNLRSSRQTELEEEHPTHVVCKWIGNSPQVARKHYLQVTDEHFERATKSGAESGALVAQNAAQRVHAPGCEASQKMGGDRHKPFAANKATQSCATPCGSRKNTPNGSTWESNPPAKRLTFRTTVLKTAAATRPTRTSLPKRAGIAGHFRLAMQPLYFGFSTAGTTLGSKCPSPLLLESGKGPGHTWLLLLGERQIKTYPSSPDACQRSFLGKFSLAARLTLTHGIAIAPNSTRKTGRSKSVWAMVRNACGG